MRTWWPAWSLAAVALCTLGATPLPSDNVLATRRERIAHMEPSDQQELLRRYERFRTLSAEEQQRLRDLEAQISADPKSTHLHDVLKRYHEWLKTLTPSQRAHLASLPAEERVKAIKDIQRDQRVTQRVESLTPKDVAVITRWVDEMIAKHRQEWLKGISKEHRQWIEKQKDPSRQRALILGVLAPRGKRGAPPPKLSQEDVDRLAAKLSDSAKAELAKATSPVEQRHVIASWVFGTLRRGESWRGGPRFSPLVGEELLQFLQNDVPPDKREKLLKMQREEMLQELRRMYSEHNRGDARFEGPERFRGGDFPRGPRPGDRGRFRDDNAPRDVSVPDDAPHEPAPADAKPEDKTPPDKAPDQTPKSN